MQCAPGGLTAGRGPAAMMDLAHLGPGPATELQPGSKRSFVPMPASRNSADSGIAELSLLKRPL